MKSLHPIVFASLLVVVAFTATSCAVMNAMGSVTSVVGGLTGNEVLESAGKSVAAVAEASAPITLEQEYYIGRSVTASLLGSYNIYDNPVLTDYVNKVC